MKVLNLSGVKKGWFGRRVKKVVARIYVKDGRVVIKSKLPSFLALRDEIQRIGDTIGFGVIDCVSTPYSREDIIVSEHKTDDPQFLEALAYWNTLYHEFDGWVIGASRNPIVDE